MTGTINTAERQLYDLCFLEQMNDKIFLREVIELYIRDTDSDLGDMKRAFNTGDFDTVFRTAHKLKSSTSLLQANKLFAILGETEIIAQKGAWPNQLDELLAMARIEFEYLKTALELHLREIDN